MKSNASDRRELTQFETTGAASDRLDIRVAGWRSESQSETGE
jgi:hypothetical protein